METPALSIVVVSYNTKDMIKRCLNAIKAAAITLPYEVIVVDNASSDGSAMLIDAQYPEIHLIRSPTNVGFSKANNAGIGIAQGEYVLLLNSDAYIQRGLAETLYQYLAKHATVAAIGPRVLNEDQSLQSKGFIFPFIWNACLDLSRVQQLLSRRVLERYLPRFFWGEMDTRPVDWVSGCCMMVKKSALLSLGGLDERFFLYWEDMEWCYRARKRHCEIWYCGSVSVIHSNRASPSPRREEIALASSALFYRLTNMRIRGCAVTLIGILSNFVSIASAIFRGNRTAIIMHLAKIREAARFIWTLSGPNPNQIE